MYRETCTHTYAQSDYPIRPIEAARRPLRSNRRERVSRAIPFSSFSLSLSLFLYLGKLLADRPPPTVHRRAAMDSRCRRARSTRLRILSSARRPFLISGSSDLRSRTRVSDRARDPTPRALRLQRNTRRFSRRNSAGNRQFARSVYLYS